MFNTTYFWFIIAYIWSISKMMMRELTITATYNSMPVENESENSNPYVGKNK